MTLNVTILTLSRIFQSADYRLSNPYTGKPLADPSTKVIRLKFKNWVALVTYAGIGRASGTPDTAIHVAKWFTGKNELTFDAAIQLLISKSNMQYASTKIAHTFVVAAIVNRRSKVAIVSNYQFRHDATVRHALGQYQASYVNPRREPQVITTGTPNALDKMQRMHLKNIVKRYPNDTQRIRLAIAELNRKAAERHPNSISPDCYIQDHDIYGWGCSESTGSSKSKPESISFGQADKSIIGPFLDKKFGIGKWSLDSSTTSSSRISPPPPECSLEYKADQNGYLLSFLDTPGGRVAHPVALNNCGIITGNAAQQWRGPSQPCIWTNEGKLVFLQGVGGICGNAVAINSEGIIAGTIEDNSRNSHAAIWDSDLKHYDFGNDEYASGLTCLNSTGYAGGYIYHHPSERGQINQRPAIWCLKDAMWDLVPIPSNHWGLVSRINSNNECLISLYDENLCVKTRIYNIKDGTQIAISVLGNEQLSPMAFTDEATVIVRSSIQKNKIIRVYYDHKVEELDFGKDNQVTCANEVAIVGWRKVDGYQTPWIFKNGENLKNLPSIKYHHTHPIAISEAGVVLGVAQSDNCAHPVKWAPI